MQPTKTAATSIVTHNGQSGASQIAGEHAALRREVHGINVDIKRAMLMNTRITPRQKNPAPSTMQPIQSSKISQFNLPEIQQQTNHNQQQLYKQQQLSPSPRPLINSANPTQRQSPAQLLNQKLDSQTPRRPSPSKTPSKLTLTPINSSSAAAASTLQIATPNSIKILQQSSMLLERNKSFRSQSQPKQAGQQLPAKPTRINQLSPQPLWAIGSVSRENDSRFDASPVSTNRRIEFQKLKDTLNINTNPNNNNSTLNNMKSLVSLRSISAFQSPMKNNNISANKERKFTYSTPGSPNTSLAHIDIMSSRIIEEVEDILLPLEQPRSEIKQKTMLSLSTSNAQLPASFVSNFRKLQSQSSIIDEVLGQFDPQSKVRNRSNIRTNSTILPTMSSQQIRQVSVEEELNYRIDSLYTDASAAVPNNNNNNLQNGQVKEILPFIQSIEQKEFESELLAKIRRKQQEKSIGSSSFRESVSLVQSANILLDSNTDQGEGLDKLDGNSVLEHIETFRQLLKVEVKREGSKIKQYVTFLLPTVSTSSFISIVAGLFQNALNAAVKSQPPPINTSQVTSNITSSTGTSGEQSNSGASNCISQQQGVSQGNGIVNFVLKKRKADWKIPDRLLDALLEVFAFQLKVIKRSEVPRLDFLLRNALSELGMSPANLLEELGGVDRCSGIACDFYKRICTLWKIQDPLSEKQITEVGIGVLTNDASIVDAFVQETKNARRILPRDISALKHELYGFLFEEYSEFFDEETKVMFMERFECIRYKHFVSMACAFSVDDAALDMYRVITNRKGFLEYFDVEMREEKLHCFVLMVVDCFVYAKKPSEIAKWLRVNSKRQIDDGFFAMLSPVIVEIFKRLKMPPTFMVNANLKMFWIKMAARCSVFQSNTMLAQIPKLIVNLSNWIENMVSMKQHGKIDEKLVRNVSFISFFMKSLFTEELLNLADIVFLLKEFTMTVEAVMFQLKGIKRVFLLMRYNTADAYAIAEFLTKTFTEAIAAVSAV